jgi:hypothetical protein
MTTPDNSLDPDGDGNFWINWDGTDWKGDIMNIGLYVSDIDGASSPITLLESLPINPSISNIQFVNNVLRYTLNDAASYVRCQIFDTGGNEIFPRPENDRFRVD